jgi:hypothetical protein
VGGLWLMLCVFMLRHSGRRVGARINDQKLE